MATHHELANFIWQIADLLRGPYRPPQYERVMLPFVVLRRFDCVLAKTKDKVVAEYERRKGGKIAGDRFHVWVRTTGRLPDEPAIHQCVLAYASDMTLLDAALIAHGRSVLSDDIMAASLDHAMWFHRPFRADEWLLYAKDSPSLAGSRGFARGLIFASDGTLVDSVAQEGLLRQRHGSGHRGTGRDTRTATQ